MNDLRPSVHERLATRRRSYREIPIDQIRIDRRYQRNVDPGIVKRIKAEFYPEGLGTILVSDVPPETYGAPPFAAVDGQTRVVALREILEDVAEGKWAGVQPVPMAIHAEVYHGAEPDECALLFRIRNSRKSVSSGDSIRISVTEGNEASVEAVETARALGYEPFGDDEHLPALTAADLKKVVLLAQWGRNKKRPTLLADALQVQIEAFAAESPDLRGSIHPLVLQATAEVLLKNPSLDQHALARSMRSIQLIVLEADGRNKTKGVSMRRAFQDVLVEGYNKGRRGAADRIKV